MLIHMRTTIEITDDLMRRAKKRASDGEPTSVVCARVSTWKTDALFTI